MIANNGQYDFIDYFNYEFKTICKGMHIEKECDLDLAADNEEMDLKPGISASIKDK